MSEKAKLYCLSGLGVDERAFSEIVLPEIEMVHVPWIPPKKMESLEEYANRLFEGTNPEEEYLLMGVSFGGMIAQEWSKIRPPKKLILISSTNDGKNISALLRIPGKLGLNRLLHPKMATIFYPISYALFGVKTKMDKQMLKVILKDTDAGFLRWATGALIHWNADFTQKAIWIHGKKDKMILPPSTTDFVTNGGHFTVYSDGNEISHFLRATIENLENHEYEVYIPRRNK
ncbi:MAG: alpha/beta hydrolase [bacterium]|nr:alpha/beta hydrolase [bacterium]